MKNPFCYYSLTLRVVEIYLDLSFPNNRIWIGFSTFQTTERLGLLRFHRAYSLRLSK